MPARGLPVRRKALRQQRECGRPRLVGSEADKSHSAPGQHGAEHVPANLLGPVHNQVLAGPVIPATGLDARRQTAHGVESIQIKGHAYADEAKPRQRISRINIDCCV